LRFLRALALVVAVSACQPAPPEGTREATPGPRVVTLAPHLAELVFAVGAGERLVGVSAYTDYPAETASLPVIGDAFAVDQERMAALAPEIVLAWASGTPARTIDGLRANGFRVEIVTTRGLDDIESALRQVGRLVDGADATSAADDFRTALSQLREAYADRARVSFFFQISERPLYTVNGDHYISELLGLCGGNNVFADLDALAPSVDVEAVVARDPDVLATSGDVSSLAVWDRFPGMRAVANDARIALPADETGRPGPRVIAAARAACEALDAILERQ
jgi:iron complex transport system substrate-binding protein